MSAAPDALRRLAERVREAEHPEVSLGVLLRQADLTQLQLAALLDEDAAAREAVAEANNSLYGSQAFFLSMDGMSPDRYHLARPIEELKRRARRARGEEDTATEALVFYADRWEICRLGLSSLPSTGGALELRACWCTRDGAVVCAIGDEVKIAALPEV